MRRAARVDANQEKIVELRASEYVRDGVIRVPVDYLNTLKPFSKPQRAILNAFLVGGGVDPVPHARYHDHPEVRRILKVTA